MSPPAMSLPAISLPATSPFDNISRAVLDVILGALLPLLLPAAGDEQAARAGALELLAAHNPRTAKELCLAAEVVAYSLRGLTLVAQSNQAGVSLDQHIAALTAACRLDSAGARAQRRLDDARRARRQQPGDEAQADAPAPEAAPASAATAPSTPQPAPAPAQMPSAAAETQVPDSSAPVATAPEPADVAQAEAALQAAEKLLKLMKDHWKGGPAPYSQAAQQIQAQQRAVNLARVTLAQARRREADAAKAADATVA